METRRKKRNTRRLTTDVAIILAAAGVMVPILVFCPPGYLKSDEGIGIAMAATAMLCGGLLQIWRWPER